MPVYRFSAGGGEHEVEVSREGQEYLVTREGQTTRVRLLHRDGPFFVLELQDDNGTRRRLRVAGSVDGDSRQLWVEGRQLYYERVRRRQPGRPAAGDGALSSSIPAVVSGVLVQPDEQVHAGDKLILLESMKMVIAIQAPFDGTVRAVNCAAGDSVQAGVPLVEIEAA